MKTEVLLQTSLGVKGMAGVSIRWGFGLWEEAGLGGGGDNCCDEDVYGAIAAPRGIGTYIICIRRRKEGDSSSPLCLAESGRSWGLEEHRHSSVPILNSPK